MASATASVSDNSRVDVLVLGRIGLDIGGSFVAPSSRVVRGMLAALSMADGNELDAHALFAQVWHERPTVERATTLPVALHRTRHWLATTTGDSVTIERSAHGYRLVLSGGRTDIDRFRRLLDPERSDDAGRRIRRLEDALSLWRGSPADCLPRGMVDATAVAELERERRSARIALGKALLEVGHAERVLELLRPSAADEPVDSEIGALLSTACRTVHG